MFNHITLFRFREEVTADQVADIRDRLLRLPDVIPAIKSFAVARDAGVRETSWDMVVLAGFDDAAGYLEYADHPEHVPLVREIGGMVTDRASVQTEEMT